MKKWFKGIILLLFTSLFEEEIDNAEPEVDKFLAEILKPYAFEK